MIKLIIQIPCLNEEETLPDALAALPREIEGIDIIETQIIDDGSTDRTVEVAKSHNVDHIVRLPRNLGLARAFMAGITNAVHQGADIIVNTDADNQYVADDIKALVEPILQDKAHLVIGTRPINDIAHFSPVKKQLQRLGSAVVRFASRTDVPDAPSGFRAISRTAAMELNVFNRYTYTLETLIQAGQKGLAITHVPVRVNGPTRPSRLIKSIPTYIRHSILTIIRIFVIYRPMRFFIPLGILVMIPGIILGLRYLFILYSGGGEGNIQSLILSSLLISTGFSVCVTGIVADLVAVNRKLLEDIKTRTMNLESKESGKQDF